MIVVVLVVVEVVVVVSGRNSISCGGTSSG